MTNKLFFKLSLKVYLVVHNTKWDFEKSNKLQLQFNFFFQKHLFVTKSQFHTHQNVFKSLTILLLNQ